MIKSSIVDFANENALTYEQILNELDFYLSEDEINDFIAHIIRYYDLEEDEDEEDN